MQNTLLNSFTSKLLAGSATLAFSLFNPVSVHAQDNLVVSPKQAETVKTQIDLDLDEDAIVTALQKERDVTIEAERQSYDQDIAAPALVENSDNSNLTVGVLASTSDTDGGDLYRDPFDVDNTEISPIYPEGVYVDYMRTDAGINLTSKF